VYRLTWCAARAATGLDSSGTELDRIGFNHLGGLPELIGRAKELHWGWIRTFLGSTGGSVAVPVALWDEATGESVGAELHLEALEGVGGAVFPHPADAFSTCYGTGFGAAMGDAWGAAVALAKLPESQALSRGGRFRVRREGRPYPEVDGRSAA